MKYKGTALLSSVVAFIAFHILTLINGIIEGDLFYGYKLEPFMVFILSIIVAGIVYGIVYMIE